jgi:hypothetical protein
MVVYLLLATLIIIILLFSNREHFTINSYNETLPITDDNSSDQDKIKLTELFKKTNKQVKKQEDIVQELPYYTEFPLKFQFKEKLKQHLNKTLDSTEYLNYKIIKDMYNIRWYDKDNNRYFLFNTDIINEKLKTTFYLEVNCILYNISNYIIVNDYSFINDPSEDIDIQSINLLQLSNDLNVRPSIQGEFYNYYTILNTLHLMDPFNTSGKDMQITQDMKSKFKTQLDQMAQIQK